MPYRLIDTLKRLYEGAFLSWTLEYPNGPRQAKTYPQNPLKVGFMLDYLKIKTLSTVPTALSPTSRNFNP